MDSETHHRFHVGSSCFNFVNEGRVAPQEAIYTDKALSKVGDISVTLLQYFAEAVGPSRLAAEASAKVVVGCRHFGLPKSGPQWAPDSALPRPSLAQKVRPGWVENGRGKSGEGSCADLVSQSSPETSCQLKDVTSSFPTDAKEI